MQTGGAVGSRQWAVGSRLLAVGSQDQQCSQQGIYYYSGFYFLLLNFDLLNNLG